MDGTTYAGAECTDLSDLTEDARQALDHLLSRASAALEHDHETAEACIVRAAAMLGVRAELTTIERETLALARGGLTPWQAKRVTAYINVHLTSKICADDLASLVQLSTSHFFRAFRESFGTAPMTYVARLRMRRAQDLMLNSRKPLSEVALECGLCDQAHFTRLFRRHIGTTPHLWRRQNSTASAGRCVPTFKCPAMYSDGALHDSDAIAAPVQ